VTVDGLISLCPEAPVATCCACGRLTCAAIEIGDVRYVCPDCVYRLPVRATCADEYPASVAGRG
jgi:hypothetical protein